jgi:hypothetical protein
MSTRAAFHLFRQLSQSDGGRLVDMTKLGNPLPGELTADPASALVCVCLAFEAAAVEPRAFTAAQPVDDSVANRPRRQLDAANPGASHYAFTLPGLVFGISFRLRAS